MDRTWTFCLAGFLLFTFGGVLRMYTVIRVKGIRGYLSRQNGVADAYSKLVLSGDAAAWVQPMMFVSIGFGIAVVFGAILMSH